MKLACVRIRLGINYGLSNERPIRLTPTRKVVTVGYPFNWALGIIVYPLYVVRSNRKLYG